MKIGAEITGSYRTFLSDDRFDSSASGFASGLPLTDAAKMSAFISKAACERGVKNARRVARYLVEGCASPMEAVLAALLHVPRSRGGYGLPKPLANYRIDMRRGDSKAAGGSYYVCDLYWPDARLCVEYDSDMFHTGSERIASDSSRRNALAFRGISVVSVTRRQIMSREEMDRVAHLLAKKLGVRFSSPLYDFGERQRALRAELLSFGSGIVGRNVWRA
ncbi:MAG: hypothetical protein Q4B69_01615 [Slackia sp.]|nr:hypothetical protein [Slackia sp.]